MATVVEIRPEAPEVATFRLVVPGWPGHVLVSTSISG
jgi:hypothetical protein